MLQEETPNLVQSLETLAEQVGAKLNVLMSTEEGKVELLKLPVIGNMIQNYLNSILPQYGKQLISTDRVNVEQVMGQVLADRKVRQQMGQEVLSIPAYEAVLADLRNVHRQIPGPNIGISLRGVEAATPGEKAAAEITSISEKPTVAQPASRLILPN